MRISENGILGHSGSEQIGIDRRRTGFVSSRDGCVEPSADARDVLFLQAVGEKGLFSPLSSGLLTSEVLRQSFAAVKTGCVLKKSGSLDFKRFATVLAVSVNVFKLLYSYEV